MPRRRADESHELESEEMAESESAGDKAAEKAEPKSGNPDASAQLLAQTLQILQQQTLIRPATPTPDLDKTEPGGKYLIDGEHVNAWGKPFKKGQDPNEGNPDLNRFNS